MSRDTVALRGSGCQSRGVNLGDHVPDLAFATTDGGTVQLADFRGEAMVLVFMRHLG